MSDKISDSRYCVNRDYDADSNYSLDMVLGERIKRLRLDRGLTQQGLADAVKRRGGKLSQGQLVAIEKGDVENPSALLEIAQVLGVDPAELRKGLPIEAIQRQEHDVDTTDTNKTQDSATEVQFVRHTNRPRGRKGTLPVWASAEGGQGAWVVNESPIAWIETPANLVDVTGAFAVRLVGESASPRYEHDDILLINPTRLIQPGDWCLFIREIRNGEKFAAVKRLVRRTQKAWLVEQLTPPKQIEFARAEWQKAFKIVGTLTDR